MSKTQAQEEVATTVAAIGAYTSTLDLFVKGIREGLLPEKGSTDAETMKEAWAGLNREVSFLRFQREGNPRAE